MQTDRHICLQASICHIVHRFSMADLRKDLKKAGQDAEAKVKTTEDHLEGKPSSETLNKAKVKTRDAANDLSRDL